MQGFIASLTRASRNLSASQPRSLNNQSAAGRLLTRALAPVSPLTWPAVIKNRIGGQSCRSQRAVAYSYHLWYGLSDVRAPLFYPQAGGRAVSLEVICVDGDRLVFRCFGSDPSKVRANTRTFRPLSLVIV